jgi:hypothetical protein
MSALLACTLRALTRRYTRRHVNDYFFFEAPGSAGISITLN